MYLLTKVINHFALNPVTETEMLKLFVTLSSNKVYNSKVRFFKITIEPKSFLKYMYIFTFIILFNNMQCTI